MVIIRDFGLLPSISGFIISRFPWPTVVRLE